MNVIPQKNLFQTQMPYIFQNQSLILYCFAVKGIKRENEWNKSMRILNEFIAMNR